MLMAVTGLASSSIEACEHTGIMGHALVQVEHGVSRAAALREADSRPMALEEQPASNASNTTQTQESANATAAANTTVAPPANTTNTVAPPVMSSPYLTRHGCHCRYDWTVENVTYYGCSALNFAGTVVQGCMVTESEEECPLSSQFTSSTLRFDSCSILTTAEDVEIVSRLDTAKDDHCHCQPEWDYQGIVYRNCAVTPDSNEPWCFILEDDSVCAAGDGVDEFNQRWRYCDETLASIVVPVVVPVRLESHAVSNFHIGIAALLPAALLSCQLA